MATRYLIDTSAVIKYINNTLPFAGLRFIDAIIDEECNISFISEIKLLAWSPPSDADLVIYSSFVSASNIIGMSATVTSETIRVRKDFRLKLPDAIIAATALVNDLTLIADNDNDFKRVEALNYVNPRKIVS
ncbi:type II toxin-antitoxin system VapC family toxin [Pedobacter sp. SYSU D00535]|uniref:type II toxin-antitoxin system VapC family toxin n=1 Tax=Pedobacter sp. SYSU D00535 TaxID=2810308 RepID=UPI001A959B64|nr:type II toxin-antitoxin system VapC family toxin [Pedobacter sp. SYSU D00535]